MRNSTRDAAARIRDNCLAVRLRMLNRVLSGLYDDALRPLDLRVSQLNVLVAVANRQPVSAGEIGDLLRLEKSTLSRNLHRMAKRGWLTVEEGRPGSVRLTRKGEGLLERALPRWEEAQQSAEALLGSEGFRAVSDAGSQLWRREGA